MGSNARPDGTLGSMLVGYAVMLSLYAITLSQTTLYLRKSAGDLLYLRSAVLLLCFIETVHLVFASYAFYTYLVTLHGDLDALAIQQWSIGVTVYVTALSNMTVRCLYAHRVFRFSIIAGFIWCVVSRLVRRVTQIQAVIGPVMGLIYGAGVAEHIPRLSTQTIDLYVYTGNGFEVLADAIIGCTMFRLLSGFRMAAPQLEPMIRNLLQFSISSGLLTLMWAILSISMFVIFPRTFIGLAFYNILSAVYINSLLVGLNGRRRFGLQQQPNSTMPILTTQVALGTSTEDEDLERMAEERWAPRDVPLARAPLLDYLGPSEESTKPEMALGC
ncbi:hypothetical protein CERSUDRAFT_127576 [Gelatoporia subvermispora B]|uniref:DUF6534 domain-containing protein n=1 Tax=Ceriporiopsis subvermispora (strain B) TaxID=914234 RepID=M2QZ51_CERS8|nr:hypothetical protein CERSUDRAFT_127576 [Gelatoporia subvermispora B]